MSDISIAAGNFQVDVSGLRDFNKVLNNIANPEELLRYFRPVLRAGAVEVLNNVKAQVRAQDIDNPETIRNTGENIIDNLAIRAGSKAEFRRTKILKQRVGILGGARLRDKNTIPKGAKHNTTYWRFIEYGTSQVAAKPFLRPAYAASRGKVFSAMEKRAKSALTRMRKDGKVIV